MDINMSGKTAAIRVISVHYYSLISISTKTALLFVPVHLYWMSGLSAKFEWVALERHENNRVRNHNACLCGRSGKTRVVIVSAYVYILWVRMCICFVCVSVCVCKVGRTSKLWGLPFISLLQKGKVLDFSLCLQHWAPATCIQSQTFFWFRSKI